MSRTVPPAPRLPYFCELGDGVTHEIVRQVREIQSFPLPANDLAIEVIAEAVWNALCQSGAVGRVAAAPQRLIEAAEHYACRLDDLSISPGHHFNAIMEILSGRDVPDPLEQDQ